MDPLLLRLTPSNMWRPLNMLSESAYLRHYHCFQSAKIYPCEALQACTSVNCLSEANAESLAAYIGSRCRT